MRALRLLSLLILTLAVAVDTQADQITFVYTGSGSGTIGATSFSNADFVITAISDTANRFKPYFDETSYFLFHDYTSIEIIGIGHYIIYSSVHSYVSNTAMGAGFSGYSEILDFGADLYQTPIDPIFGQWDMLTSIGPVEGSGFRLLQWDSFAAPLTDGGLLIFDDDASVMGSFQAIVAPEPAASQVMGAMSSIWIATYRIRSRRIGFISNTDPSNC